MNLLSIGAAYGIVVALFQWGWLSDITGVQPAPIEPWMPMMLFAIVFGLSMDYEVFLLSRVREEWHRTGDSRTSVADGLAATAKVITAAAAIMVVRVRQLPARGRPGGQADGRRSGHGDPARRHHRPHAAGAGHHGAAGRQELVAAPLARPAPAQPRRRGPGHDPSTSTSPSPTRSASPPPWAAAPDPWGPPPDLPPGRVRRAPPPVPMGSGAGRRGRPRARPPRVKSVGLILSYLAGSGRKQNLRLVAGMVGILVALVALYSADLPRIMAREGREHSWATGVYWTLTTMSTLGLRRHHLRVRRRSDLLGGRARDRRDVHPGRCCRSRSSSSCSCRGWSAVKRTGRPRELPEDESDHIVLTQLGAGDRAPVIAGPAMRACPTCCSSRTWQVRSRPPRPGLQGDGRRTRRPRHVPRGAGRARPRSSRRRQPDTTNTNIVFTVREIDAHGADRRDRLDRAVGRRPRAGRLRHRARSSGEMLGQAHRPVVCSAATAAPTSSVSSARCSSPRPACAGDRAGRPRTPGRGRPAQPLHVNVAGSGSGASSSSPTPTRWSRSPTC